jgi:hypothetical protein
MNDEEARYRGEPLDSYRLRMLEKWRDSFEEKYDKESGNQARVLIGILVALATAAILLALNLAVSVGGQ